MNPFLDPAFAIRWSELTADRVEPAITAALAEAQTAVDAIANQPLSALTYASTFLALETATETLGFAWGRVSHLQSVADAPAIRAAHNAMLPKVSAFYSQLRLNPELWRRLQAFAASPAAIALTGIDRRFLAETVADFREAGADLAAETRGRLEAVQTELAALTQKYAENVLDSTNAWQRIVEDDSLLAGLPAHAVAAARRSAESKGLGTAEQPAWRFTLQGPSQEPFLTYLENDGLRREMWSAAVAVGAQAPHDNTPLIARILTLRAEKARLLGKAHFADATLERRMAKSGARALEFISDLQALSEPAFRRECRELEEFKGPDAVPGLLAPWELAFWSERMRRQRYDFDAEVLRPYLPMDRVIAGLFELAGRVFGLRVTARPTFAKATADAPATTEAGAVEVWHPDVKFYDVVDAAGRPVGSFYADWHPREAKRGGAWMNYLWTGGPHPDGTRAPHLGLICGNLTPPAEGRPALLTHREVETIFHEFGHLLHHLLGEVPIKSLNGVNVAWDFVELPSQIMENWCWERASLDLFARHFETGAPIPEAIFRKMVAAKNFRSATFTMRQVALAKLDLLLHTRTAAFAAAPDVEPMIRAAVADCLIPTAPPAPTLVKRFTHIFSDPTGYAAGYYSYKWAEVLDADAFTRFRREGLFSAKVGGEFVAKILSRGNSADPAELFRDFMGRDPDLGALLERSGLAAAAALAGDGSI
jgi:oligopeptidase A